MTNNDLLHRAVCELASRNEDMATIENAIGYNGSDSYFGNTLAATPVERWTPANRRAAWEMLRKYRKQLSNYGVDYDLIPEPPKQESRGRRVNKAGSTRVYMDGGDLAMTAPYDDALVAAQKAVPGRRWNGTANTFPAASASAVRELMDRFPVGWEVTPEAQALLDNPPAPPQRRGRTHLTVDGQTFSLHFDYDKNMVSLARNIQGRRWNAAAKTNEYPVQPQAAVEIRAFLAHHEPTTYGTGAREALESAADRYADVQAEREALAELSRASDANFHVDGLGGEMRPFQKAGVAYALRSNGRTFIADDMGTGKTVQALAAIQATGSYPAVVVCPASVKLSWRDHVQGPAAGAPEGWLPGKSVQVLKGRKPNGEQLAGADVIVINWDILDGWLPALKALNPRALVLDESHYGKSPKAKRTKAAQELAESIPAEGLVLALTGTAVLNRPIELVPQLKMIGRLDDFGGFWKFAKAYCAAFKDTYGWDLSGASNLEQLNAKLRETCFIRRMKSDVMKELPEKQIARVPLTIDNADEYDSAERDVAKFLGGLVAEEDRGEVITKTQRAEQLVKINTLRQVVARGKLAGSISWIRNFLDSSEGEKLIVFAAHVEVQEALTSEFPEAAHVLGSDSVEVRNDNVCRFQQDPNCRLVICSLAAAGIGITLTAASNVAFLELGWTPALHDQAEDRAHRMGQAGQVTCWYLLADGTIDEDMHALIEEKRAVVTAATDGKATQRDVSIMSELADRIMQRH